MIVADNEVEIVITPNVGHDLAGSQKMESIFSSEGPGDNPS